MKNVNPNQPPLFPEDEGNGENKDAIPTSDGPTHIVEPDQIESLLDIRKKQLASIDSDQLDAELQNASDVIMNSPDDDGHFGNRRKSSEEIDAEQTMKLIFELKESRKAEAEIAEAPITEELLDELSRDTFSDWYSRYVKVRTNAIRERLNGDISIDEEYAKIDAGLEELGDPKFTSVEEIEKLEDKVKNLLRKYNRDEVESGSKEAKIIDTALKVLNDLERNKHFISDDSYVADAKKKQSEVESSRHSYLTKEDLEELLIDRSFDERVLELFTPEETLKLTEYLSKKNMAYGRVVIDDRRFGDASNTMDININSLRNKIVNKFFGLKRAGRLEGDAKNQALNFFNEFVDQYSGRELGGNDNKKFDDMTTEIERIEHLSYRKRQRLNSLAKKIIDNRDK
jgi:hypothetical protein